MNSEVVYFLIGLLGGVIAYLKFTGGQSSKSNELENKLKEEYSSKQKDLDIKDKEIKQIEETEKNRDNILDFWNARKK